MRFLTTNDLLNGRSEELFDPNWMNSETPVYPPNPLWDNSRPLNVEDVDIWEVIVDGGFSYGLYASWCPYAEFYLVIVGGKWSTFYGPGAQKALKKYIAPHNFPLSHNEFWVEDSDAHLFLEDWYVFNENVHEVPLYYAPPKPYEFIHSS